MHLWKCTLLHLMAYDTHIERKFVCISGLTHFGCISVVDPSQETLRQKMIND
jgi:hypothetical protein